MAQLKSTTVNGDLSVTENIILQGALTLGEFDNDQWYDDESNYVMRAKDVKAKIDEEAKVRQDADVVLDGKINDTKDTLDSHISTKSGNPHSVTLTDVEGNAVKLNGTKAAAGSTVSFYAPTDTITENNRKSILYVNSSKNITYLNSEQQLSKIEYAKKLIISGLKANTIPMDNVNYNVCILPGSYLLMGNSSSTSEGQIWVPAQVQNVSGSGYAGTTFIRIFVNWGGPKTTLYFRNLVFPNDLDYYSNNSTTNYYDSSYMSLEDVHSIVAI